MTFTPEFFSRRIHTGYPQLGGYTTKILRETLEDISFMPELHQCFNHGLQWLERKKFKDH